VLFKRKLLYRVPERDFLFYEYFERMLKISKPVSVSIS
jgi:hypothetical protein